GASAHAVDTRVNTAKPARNTRRRPNLSPSAAFAALILRADDDGVAADGVNPRLGRGISFGNALDAAGGGPEFRLRERYFDDVRNAGFGPVRLPVRWSAHAGQFPRYVIGPAFFGRVDWAVSQALRRDLNVVLNVPHYHELNAAPRGHRARFLAVWAQIAA